MFNHLFAFIWFYLTLNEFICIGTSLNDSNTMHDWTIKCVLNPSCIGAEQLTTPGNMLVTADSCAAVLRLPFASATKWNAILDPFMWTSIPTEAFLPISCSTAIAISSMCHGNPTSDFWSEGLIQNHTSHTNSGWGRTQCMWQHFFRTQERKRPSLTS